MPIRYGFPAYDDAWSVQERLFPHSNSYGLGGCVISENNPRDEQQWVCTDCRIAEKQWRAENTDLNVDER